MTHTKSGFTLMELMIAIVILGILGAVGIPAYLGYVKQANISTTKQNLKLLSGAITLFKAQTGDYPQSLTDLIKRPSGEVGEDWAGPYLKGNRPPKDGFKKPFVYRPESEGEGRPYTLFSYGASGRRGKRSDRISVWGR